MMNDLPDFVRQALEIAGYPEFRSPEDPEGAEQLLFFPASPGGEPAVWGLVPTETDAPEPVVVDPEMAEQLLRGHFRDWLIMRGWQVQVRCRTDSREWRLVDCLHAADGGGDRLDVDYPRGDDELAVLAASVLAVNTIAR